MAVTIKVKWNGVPEYNGYNRPEIYRYVKEETYAIFQELGWLEDGVLSREYGTFHVEHDWCGEIRFDRESTDDPHNSQPSQNLNVNHAWTFVKRLAKKTSEHRSIEKVEFFFVYEQDDSREFRDQFEYFIVPQNLPDRKYLEIKLNRIHEST